MKQINLNNKYRVVLTEILPNEVPLMFDNDSFYQNIIDDKKKQIFEQQFNVISGRRDDWWFIPFNYSVRRYGGEHSRLLSIVHPFIQLVISDFYNQYADYLLYLCNRSPFSIRYISHVSKCIFEIDKENEDESESDDEEDIQTHAKYKNYFTYKGYDRLYKFFDDVEQTRLEQKYKYCMKLDLSKCFYHIYTHSIAWAVKGKDFAKSHLKAKSLECKFDNLMQHCNYNETNGIVVGPEVSRIFAEIILQRIDLDILNDLKSNNIILGRDYEIRRYVDDYFVFANDELKFDIIRKVFEKKCEPYKLYINEKKVQIIKRPFSTNISNAKIEVKDLIEVLKEKYFSINEKGFYKRSFSDSSWGLTEFAHKYGSIIFKNNVNYSDTNRYCLFLLKKIIKHELKNRMKPSEGQALSIIEIVFYVFSLDMNASGSIQISSIIDTFVDWINMIDDKDTNQKIIDRLYREAKRCFDIYLSTTASGQTNLEMLNLLLALKRKTNFDIRGDLIKKIFSLEIQGDVKKGFDKLDYFQICTILYVLETGEADIFSSLISEVERRFKETNEPLKHAELTLLYFDILTCPYIDDDKKTEIYAIVQKKENNSDIQKSQNKGNMRKIGNLKKWFFDWDKNKNLSSIIRKKEYIPAYQ